MTRVHVLYVLDSIHKLIKQPEHRQSNIVLVIRLVVRLVIITRLVVRFDIATRLETRCL